MRENMNVYIGKCITMAVVNKVTTKAAKWRMNFLI